jgi:hypothetical protein
MHLYHLDTSGAIVDDVALPIGTQPALAWNGNGFGLTWLHQKAVYFAELDRAGALLAEPLQVSAADTTAGRSSLVWDGAGYGVALQISGFGESGVYFTHLTR